MPFKLLGPSNKLRQQSVIFLDLNNNHTNQPGLHRSMLKKLSAKLFNKCINSYNLNKSGINMHIETLTTLQNIP